MERGLEGGKEEGKEGGKEGAVGVLQAGMRCENPRKTPFHKTNPALCLFLLRNI